MFIDFPETSHPATLTSGGMWRMCEPCATRVHIKGAGSTILCEHWNLAIRRPHLLREVSKGRCDVLMGANETDDCESPKSKSYIRRMFSVFMYGSIQ